MEEYLHKIEQSIRVGISKNFKTVSEIDEYSASLDIKEPNKEVQEEYVIKKHNEKYPKYRNFYVGVWKAETLVKKILCYNALYNINLVKLEIKSWSCGHVYNMSYMSDLSKDNQLSEFKSAVNEYEILKGYKTPENDMSPIFFLFSPSHNVCSEEAAELIKLYDNEFSTWDNWSETVKMLDYIKPDYGRTCNCFVPQISIIQLDEFYEKKRELVKQKELEKNKDNNGISFNLDPNDYQPSGGTSGYIFHVTLTKTIQTLEELCINKLKINHTKKDLCEMGISQDLRDKYNLFMFD